MLLNNGKTTKEMIMTKEEKKKAIEQKQFELAMEGNVEMLKWLGINICGQDRKPDLSDGLLDLGWVSKVD